MWAILTPCQHKLAAQILNCTMGYQSQDCAAVVSDVCRRCSIPDCSAWRNTRCCSHHSLGFLSFWQLDWTCCRFTLHTQNHLRTSSKGHLFIANAPSYQKLYHTSEVLGSESSRELCQMKLAATFHYEQKAKCINPTVSWPRPELRHTALNLWKRC